MQRSFIALVILTLFLIPLYPVYAQSIATSSPAKRPTTALERAKLMRDNLQASPGANKANLHDKIASRGAQLKEKLAKFKDKKKAQIAERINDNLNKINERRTSQMMDHLSRLSNILDKLGDRVNSAQQNGKDMSGANLAITDARVKIDAAEASVSAQKLKDYTIESTSESTIKADAQKMRNNLHVDLQDVHSLVVIARQAVAKAISEAVSSIKGGSDGS